MTHYFSLQIAELALDVNLADRMAALSIENTNCGHGQGQSTNRYIRELEQPPRYNA